MQNKSEFLCMAPWVHTYLSPLTERRMCCASREPAQNFEQYIDTAKAGITEHLRSADVPPQYRDKFDHIIDFMNTGASTDGFITRMKIRDLDRKRQQDFAQVAPEIAELINYESQT